MPLSPDDFLWVIVLSGFSFLLLTGSIYLFCCPWDRDFQFSLLKTFRKKKAAEKPLKVYCTNNNVCHNDGQNKFVKTVGQLQPPQTPVITGPQGHGFYTSGPWKIDPMQNSMTMQFSQPNFIMADYFNSAVESPSTQMATPEESSDSRGIKPACQIINNLLMCSETTPSHAYWNSGFETDPYYQDHSNSIGKSLSNNSLFKFELDEDYHDLDVDADMMMMFM